MSHPFGSSDSGASASASASKKRSLTSDDDKQVTQKATVKKEPASGDQRKVVDMDIDNDDDAGNEKDLFFTASTSPKRPKKKNKKSSVASTDEVGSSGVMAPSSASNTPSNVFANNDDVKFWLQFNSPGQLIQMINIAAETLKVARFKVVRTSEFQGVQIISMDEHGVALVRSHLECLMVKAPPLNEPVNFQIQIATLKTLLAQVSSGSVVEWGWHNGADRQVMHSYERDTGSYVRTFEIPLFAQADGEVELPPLKVHHFSFVIEIELGMLKDFIKCSKELKAERISVHVLEHTVPGSKVTTHYLILGANGDTASSKCIFRSQSRQDASQEDEDGNPVPVLIRTSNSLEATQNAHADFQKHEQKCKKCYAEEFPCEYLSNFVKSMSKTNVVIELQPDGPIWLKYTLGPKSFIEQICSPAVKEGDA